MMKMILRLVGIAAVVGLGYYIRSVMPAGGPPAGMGGMGGMGAMPPPSVVAVELKEVPLDVQDEYIATIAPVQEVMVRTEVAGYIDEVHFKEGAAVQEGDLLFTIDRKQYQAMVEVREAELARAQAELNRASKFLERVRSAGERSVSQSDVDTAESDQLQAVANLKQAEANLNLARIDLGYAEIRSPIGGRIGEAMATKGNYVSSDSGALARIVQTDPIRVVFSMTDRAYLNLRRKELDDGAPDGLVARVRLPNGAVLPRVGKKDFDDNEMNAETGTMAVRYLFDNPDEMLVSGGYAMIMLGEPERPMGLRIPQQAILVDPQGSYVLTAGADGLIGTARVQLGKTLGNHVVVQSGLKAGDRVVIDGVQKVQAGATATVTLQEAAQ